MTTPRMTPAVNSALGFAETFAEEIRGLQARSGMWEVMVRLEDRCKPVVAAILTGAEQRHQHMVTLRDMLLRAATYPHKRHPMRDFVIDSPTRVMDSFRHLDALCQLYAVPAPLDLIAENDHSPISYYAWLGEPRGWPVRVMIPDAGDESSPSPDWMAGLSTLQARLGATSPAEALQTALEMVDAKWPGVAAQPADGALVRSHEQLIALRDSLIRLFGSTTPVDELVFQLKRGILKTVSDAQLTMVARQIAQVVGQDPG